MKTTHRRLNITLPETTVHLLETVANKGERSIFIDKAIRAYIKNEKQKILREQIKEGAIARNNRDLTMANEWFGIEEELWQD